MTNNPIEVAMKLAGLSVERIADMLEVSRQTINNYMKNPEQMNIRQLLVLSDETGIAMDKLCGPSKKAIGPNIDSSYEKCVEKLRHFVSAAEKTKKEILGLKIDNELDICNKARDQLIFELDNIIDGARIKGRKPTVCAFGPSDAGKSTLMNYLIGEDIVPADFAPLTTVPIYIKHVTEKPSFLEDPADNAIVIGRKKGASKIEYDFEQILAGEIAEDSIIRTGNYKSVLREFGTREGEYYKNSNFVIESIVAFVDKNNLREFTFVDFPGFGSGDDNDNVSLAMDASVFDIVFFLSQADAYMRGPELAALNHILRMRDDLSSLFILATHSNAIGDPNKVESIIVQGCNRTICTMADAEKDRLGLSEEDFSALRSRCFAFDTASTKTCQLLNKRIEEEFPAIVEKRVFEAVAEAEKASKEYQRRYKNLYDNLDQERRSSKSSEETNEKKEKSREAQKKALERLVSVKSKMRVSINNNRSYSVSKMKAVYEAIVNEKFMVDAINRKDLKNKKADMETLSNYINSELNEGMQQITTERSNAFAREIDEELKWYQANLKNDNIEFEAGINFDGFDFTGAFAAGLAGLATYGALAAWAIVVAQGSNLGAYILVAKVVSALSALGISLGGTASVASFVAAIGGPVVVGIALAMIAAVAVFGIFTGTWKNRVAKRLVEAYGKNEVLNNYTKAINKYWDDTENALDACVKSLSDKVREYYDNQIKASEMAEEARIKMNTVLQMLYGRLHEGYAQMYEVVQGT